MGIDIKNISTTGATLYYVGTSIDYSNKKDIDWYLDGSYVGSSVISAGDLGSNGCWLSGLTPSTYYSVRANITWYGGGGGTKVETSGFTTLAQPPVINSISATPYRNSVWLVVDAKYATSYDYALYYRSGNTMGSLVEEKLNRASSSIEFANLKASTQYRVRVTARNSSSSVVWDRDFTTLDFPRPSNFYWSDKARNAFNRVEGCFTTDVTYTEWNSFVERVKEFFLWYWNRSSDEENIESAKMSASDKVLYATKFNKVRSIIGGMNSTGITDKVKGDNVLGGYFLTMESKMNAVLSPRSILESGYVPPQTEDEAQELFNGLFDEVEKIEEEIEKIERGIQHGNGNRRKNTI